MSTSLYARLARRFGPRVTSAQRREMLKATFLASAGLLISGNRTLGAILRPAFGAKRVCVVGGGFSGLACAYELASAGYDVTVVEARNRVGGRVLSLGDLIPGKNVEGGGELIGSNHPTWVQYKEKFGLEFLDVTESEDAESPIILGGQRLSAAESNELYEQMTAALKPMNADAASVLEDEPWNTPGAAALDARTTQNWIAAQECSALCKMGIAAMLVADNGAPVARQSYLGNLTMVKGGGLEKFWTDSEVFRCKGGNQQLATRLAKELKDRVILGLAVRSIQASSNSVKVQCADGRTIEVDDVILAVPPTLWSKLEIQPALPASLAPQMGTNVKYLSAVKSRFWTEAKLAPSALTDADVSMTWEATDGQPDAEGGGSGAAACLTAFSGGPAAETCRARQGEPLKAAYAAALESLYPGYSKNVTATRFMDWPADPLTMAGYSFPAPGQVTTIGPMLRKGHGGGGDNLHFAGEHCCYKFVGYMEGTLNSGVAVARRLAARDGVK